MDGVAPVHIHRAAHRSSARQFLGIIYGSWFLALAFGSVLYVGEHLDRSELFLPLRHVDALFRRAGGLVVFGAWALRASIKNALYLRGDGRREHIWVPAALYAAQAAVRTAVHQLHGLGVLLSPSWWLHWQSPDEEPPHVMSDHVLLAATVVGGLGCEAVLLFLSLAHRRHRASPLLLKGLAVLATALAVLISAEIFFTARYFHPPVEVVAGAVLGLALFQAPLLLFTQRLLRAHEEGDGDHKDERSVN